MLRLGSVCLVAAVAVRPTRVSNPAAAAAAAAEAAAMAAAVTVSKSQREVAGLTGGAAAHKSNSRREAVTVRRCGGSHLLECALSRQMLLPRAAQQLCTCPLQASRPSLAGWQQSLSLAVEARLVLLMQAEACTSRTGVTWLCRPAANHTTCPVAACPVHIVVLHVSNWLPPPLSCFQLESPVPAGPAALHQVLAHAIFCKPHRGSDGGAPMPF